MNNQTKFNPEGKTFDAVCEYLQIPEFSKRIFNSNSKGELFHIYDYVAIAKRWQGSTDLFRELFLHLVNLAETKWERPDSVFQHLHKSIYLAAFELNKYDELLTHLGLGNTEQSTSGGTPAA